MLGTPFKTLEPSHFERVKHAKALAEHAEKTRQAAMDLAQEAHSQVAGSLGEASGIMGAERKQRAACHPLGGAGVSTSSSRCNRLGCRALVDCNQRSCFTNKIMFLRVQVAKFQSCKTIPSPNPEHALKIEGHLLCDA